ncbi:MAG TPA: TonB-dependent receptor plug domain-containing protein [Xanthomonadaceae bacterium]|nr:TonB-dependent receptor plug domain-containing protein [Xanthomonadaceae bacterium]
MPAHALSMILLVAVQGASVAATPPLPGAADVQVHTREDIARSGLTTLVDFLRQLPQFDSPANARITGGGESRVALGTLGSPGTLVLVDGRRWAPGAGGAVDLSAIPLALVERIEVHRGGGGYGDAVGGVVDIVTATAPAARARAFAGAYEQGDGDSEAYEFAVHAQGERSSVSFFGSFVE